MRIIITGGTGLIGSALIDVLTAADHEIIVLSRNPDEKGGSLPANVRAERWDATTAAAWGHLADGAAAIVNLAGDSIAGEAFFPQRWTAEKRQRIRRSRLDAGRAVMEAVTAATNKPAVVVQASASGYYGTSETATFIEASPPGDDFLAAVCVDWENATAAVTEQGVRQVICRMGVVLSHEGGALSRLQLPFKLFAGGRMGDGRQWISWIHIDDVARAIAFLINHQASSGPYNLTAPEPVRNRQFAQSLGRVMKRPSFLPVPGFAMRAAFGEVATVVVDGQQVLPQRLQEAGFAFKFPKLADALRDLVG